MSHIRPLASLLAFALAAARQAAEVGSERLLAAADEPANWLSYGRDYGNQRFSPLTQIDRRNVHRLVPR
ncbi:MAG: hypothetical protein KDH15_17455 [Rhodocyclaceae bacterium]|nr:hypothetical protein [Rhodocyclaceae bacterium]